MRTNKLKIRQLKQGDKFKLYGRNEIWELMGKGRAGTDFIVKKETSKRLYFIVNPDAIVLETPI